VNKFYTNKQSNIFIVSGENELLRVHRWFSFMPLRRTRYSFDTVGTELGCVDRWNEHQWLSQLWNVLYSKVSTKFDLTERRHFVESKRQYSFNNRVVVIVNRKLSALNIFTVETMHVIL